MALTTLRLNCCGICELANIAYENPADAVAYYLTQRFPYELAVATEEQWATYSRAGGAYVIFSQVEPHQYGAKLATYIKEHDLGTVVQIETKLNPNSGNSITPFVWVINPTTCLALLRKILDPKIQAYRDKLKAANPPAPVTPPNARVDTPATNRNEVHLNTILAQTIRSIIDYNDLEGETNGRN